VGFYIPIFMSLRSKPLECYSVKLLQCALLLAARHARADPLIFNFFMSLRSKPLERHRTNEKSDQRLRPRARRVFGLAL
jgi:hypothetical protein